MGITGGPKLIELDSLEFSMDPGSIRSYPAKDFGLSKINTRTWTISSGSVGGYSQNGATDDNIRAIGNDPWGNPTVVWTAYPDGSNSGEGGWVTSNITIDNSKTYRFCTWVKRTVYEDGRFYFGVYTYNSGGSNIANARRTTGTTSTNNYPYYSNDPPSFSQMPDSEWILAVYHVWPAGSGTGANHTDSGLYTINDGKYANIYYDIVPDAAAYYYRHRTYFYYSILNTPRQHWVYPMVHVCDGTEPSIQDLLDGKERGIYNAHTNEISGHITQDALWYPSGGGSFLLDTTYRSINIPDVLNSEAIGASTTKTIMFWFKANVLGQYMAFSTGQTGNDRIYFWTDNNQHTWRVGDYTDLTGHSTMSTDTWYHTTLVIDGNTLYAYLNGVLDYSDTYTSFTTVDNAVFGRHGDTLAYSFNGYIGQAAIWNKALSRRQIKEIYERQKGRYR